MPRRDGTGPEGMGPMTGRGSGGCSPNQAGTNVTGRGSRKQGRGVGQGGGQGGGQGAGRGKGQGRGRQGGRGGRR